MPEKRDNRFPPIDSIPSRLEVVLLSFKHKRYPVPFASNKLTRIQREKSGKENQSSYCLIAHISGYEYKDGKPSPVVYTKTAILGMYTEEEGNSILKFLFRVSLNDMREENGKNYANWKILSEVKPSPQEFFSEISAEQIRHIEQFVKSYDPSAFEDILPHPNTIVLRSISMIQIGMLVDRIAWLFNVFAYSLKVVSYLVKILDELNITVRFRILWEALQYIRIHKDEFSFDPEDDIVTGTMLENHKNSEALSSSEETNELRIQNIHTLINIIFSHGEKDNNVQDDGGENSERLDLSETEESPAIKKMRDDLSKHIIGQERPIRMLARTFNLAKAGNIPKKGPLSKMIFAGPKGVGKTELAVTLAEWLNTQEKKALGRAKAEKNELPFTEDDIQKPSLITVPCGDFAGGMSHGVADLVGAPVGFVGSKSDQHGAQRPIFNPDNFPQNRITVLLFDEIEEAFVGARNEGMELMGILMEALETGRYTNRWQEEVDFSRTIVISTCNVGSEKIMESVQESKIGFKGGEKKRRKRRLTEEEIEHLNEKIYIITREEFRKTFKHPQFRDRLGRLIVFRLLNESNYQKIIPKIFFEEVQEWAGREPKIKVELSQEAFHWILDELNFEEGVRDLRTFIRKDIAEPLARAHNLKRLKKGRTYIVRTKEVPVRNGSKVQNGETELKADFYIKPVASIDGDSS